MVETKMLMQYLDVLLKLEVNGYNCRRKVDEVLEELHKRMGFKSNSVNISADGAIKINSGVITLPNIITTDASWGNSKTAKEVAEEIASSLKKMSTDNKDKETNIFDIFG